MSPRRASKKKIVQAANNATLRLAENEINEMRRRGQLVEDKDTKKIELRTFTPSRPARVVFLDARRGRLP